MWALAINFSSWLLLILAGHVHSHSVNIHPKRATGIVGGQVQINCGVEFGLTNQMTWDFNNEFVYVITNGIENYPLGTSKYSVHRSGMIFTLEVKDLSLEDGGEYMCTSYHSENTSVLVVLDTPSITINPPAPLEGETANVTCEAKFGGPKKDLILPDHHPNLKMYFKDSSNDMVKANDTSNVKKHYLISKTKNLTVRASMNERYIICEIGTAEPLLNTSVDAVLCVHYSSTVTIAVDQPEPENGGSQVTIAVVIIIIIILGVIALLTFLFRKKLREIIQQRLGRSGINQNVTDPEPHLGETTPLQVTDPEPHLGETTPLQVTDPEPHLGATTPLQVTDPEPHLGETTPLQVEEPRLSLSECIELIRPISREELDRHGKEIVRVLQENELSIVEQSPDILIGLIKKAASLIDSEYYEDIIKVIPYRSKDSPLKYLKQVMDDEESFEKLFENQNKLFSVIKSIAEYGEDQYRTECLKYIINKRTFGVGREKREYSFEWSEEYLSTLKDLLDKGADPTWISPEELEKERRYYRTTAQNEFFGKIFVNLLEKNDLHESLLGVVILMLSKKCKDNELLPRTLLHEFVGDYDRWGYDNLRWDYIATNLESMPRDFFIQFKNILREILIHDGTLLVQKDFGGRTPLQMFLIKIELEERIFGEVREIIQMLQSPQVLSAKDNRGLTALHYLAFCFPVIRGEVSQSGRESFLELVKSFANESNVGCQDENGETALHCLAYKFPGGISEEWREVYQDLVKHLATYDILEIKDKKGNTALHTLADKFTFEIEDWRMETFVEVLKCLAVPRTICIKDEKGKTALKIISRKWGKKVPEHYKDKFKEISDILSGNN